MRWSRRRLVAALVVFAVALAVRLVFVGLFATEPQNDLLWNDAVGWNLANGHGFTASQSEPRVPGIYRTPAYPAFLAVVYTVAGHSHRAAYVAQSVVDALSALVVAAIALHLTSPAVALLAGGLYAIYPYAAIYCGVLHQDILLTFVTLLAVLAMVRAVEPGRTWRAWGTVGLAVGLTALVKANFLLFLFAPLVVILLAVRGRAKRALAFTAVVTAMLAILGPWIGRNYVTFRAFPPLAAGATGVNAVLLLEELNAGEASMVARLASRPGERDQSRYLSRFVDGAELMASEKALVQQTAPELLRRWPEVLVLMVRKIPRLWITQYAMGYSPFVATAAALVSWAVLLVGVIGMWLARREWRGLLPLYVTIATVTLMYLPYTSEARYTLPARAALLVFVAHALVAAFDAVASRQRAVAAVATPTEARPR